MSVERTFEKTSDIAQLKEWCQELGEHLAECLKDKNLWGKTVTLKLKTSTFVVKTRAMALPVPTNDGHVITSAAERLLAAEIRCATPQPLELRLMGVRMSRFVSESDPSVTQRQQTLDLLLEKNSIQTKQLPCPVCSSVCFTSVRELTAHIDVCLGSCASEDGENKSHDNSLLEESETEVQNAHVCHADKSVAMQTSNNSLPCLPALAVSDAACSDPNPSSSDKQTYVCPVCNKTKHFASLDDFNSHVDVCLNSDAIKTILKSDDCNTRKRQATNQKSGSKKRKGVPVTLHSFFRKS